MRLANQDELGPGLQAQQAAEGAQGFGNALVRFEESEDADERGGLIHAEAFAAGPAIGGGNPGAVRNARDGPRESRGADLVEHALAVDDDGAGALQNLADHGHAFVVGPNFQRAHAPGVGERRLSALVFHFAQVGVPVAAADGEIGDQVVQVGFVHHHHAGMPQRHLVDELVIGRLVEDFHPDQAGQRLEQCGRIIRDAAFRGRHGREESQPHLNAPVRARRRQPRRERGS